MSEQQQANTCPLCGRKYDRRIWPRSACAMGYCPALNVLPADLIAVVSPPTAELTAQSVLDQSLNTLQQIRALTASSRSYVPQNNAAEMMLRLEALGFGTQERRRGNTLWAMVMDAADEIESLRAASAQPPSPQSETAREIVERWIIEGGITLSGVVDEYSLRDALVERILVAITAAEIRGDGQSKQS